MINVAVMFGGRSVEHDVSIISAIQAMENFDKSKYNVYPVYITKDNEFYYGESLKSLKEFYNKESLLQKSSRVVFAKNNGKVRMMYFPFSEANEAICEVDVVFPIVHGTNVEDGILQGYLKTLDVPFVGCDVLSSAIGMDKYVMKVLLRSEGFPVLDGIRFSVFDYENVMEVVEAVERKFDYPVIVKPVNLGSSVGVSKANNRSELVDSVELSTKFATKILIEPAIVNLKEVNCSVLGNEKECIVSECEEPVTTHEFLDFEEKYISGAKKCGSKGMASLKRKIPAEIDAETKQNIQKIAQRAFKYLECCGVIRLDFMIDMDSNTVWLNEINTIPGSLAFYLWEAIGMSYPDLIDRLIDLAVTRYEKEKTVNYTYESSIIENLTAK